MVMGSPAELKKGSRQRSFTLAEKSYLSSRGITTAELRSKLNKNNGKQSSVHESPRRNLPRNINIGELNIRDNVQDKSSNFGVFDWGSPERRKYERTRVPLRGRDVRSSLIMSDEKRIFSSKEQLSSPKEEAGHYPVVHGNKVPHRQFVGKDHMGIKLEMGARENSNSKVFPKNAVKLTKTRLSSSDSINGGREISKDKLEESGFLPFADNYTNTTNTINFVPHKDGGSLAEFEHTTSDYGRITRTNCHTFYDFATLSSDVSYSCPLPCEFQSNRWTDIDLSTPIGVEVTKHLYEGSHPLTKSYEKPDLQFEDNDGEYNKATVRPANQIFAEPSDGMGTQEVENNAGFNRLNRVLSFIEATATPQLRSTPPSGKICSPVNNSNKSAANAQSRSSQSPLRRILNQVLKPKASNFADKRPSNLHESSTQESPLRDPLTLAHTAHQLLASRSSSSTDQPMRRNLNFLHLAQDDKNMPSSTKAILQLVYKDGLPLFTFTSNKKGDIMVARMKKVFTTGKDDFEWVYTFHTVPEARKNSVGWINQGSQCKKYVPTIIGHMKVLCSQCPKQEGKGSEYSVSVKEFVLFGAKLTETAHEDLNFLPNNELAAIVVTSEKQQSDNNGDISKTESLQNASSVGCRDPSSSVTVIVPSGDHGLPVVGLPSTLIDRWRSGGSCDCGGWDLGCLLTIFIGQDHQNLNSSQSYFSSEATHLVDLSVQGRQQENKHALSFSAFKEWIYSVDFSAPISSLQAFSICVAILHGKIPTSPAEIFRSVEAKTLAMTMLAGGKTKSTSITQGEVPASYIQCPPHSPVGRV